jgi:hypothetical protein
MRSFALIVVLAAIVACNPFDPPLYRTPLPNDYAQDSNGGEFGMLVKPTGPTISEVIAPRGPGPNGRRRYCNTFGWVENLVICEVTEYGDRAFVDPPLSREYLILDTTNGSVVYYKTHPELVQAWSAATAAPLPPLAKEHSSRTKK